MVPSHEHRAITCFFLFLFLIIASIANAADTTLQNDGFYAGAGVGFQGGFVTGEIGASRFTPPGSVQLKQVLFLFGGAGGSATITLHIWDDSALRPISGVELYSNDYLLTPSDTDLQQIDLSGESIYVSGPFRVGIQFQQDGYPSIARDDDGTITSSLNYINASGLGWYQSSLLGLTGDWIIRAVVGTAPASYTVGGTVSGLNGILVLQNNGGDDLVISGDGAFSFATPLTDGSSYEVTVLSAPANQNCVVSMGTGTISGSNVTNVSVSCSDKPTTVQVLQHDSFIPGQNAGFQAGFVANEIAAVRFTPPGLVHLEAVRFLFGGASGLTSIRLHVWDDAAETDDPGTELLAQDYLIDASDVALQEIDLGSQGLQLTGPFRVGVELLAAGLPSVARDDDGNIDSAVNFILGQSIGWVKSSTVGLTGDWILRAIVSLASSFPEPIILAVDDIGNDQGGQVRLSFQSSSQDALGATQPVLSYEAYRRIDSLPFGAIAGVSAKKLAGWEYVGAVPAHGETEYNMIVPTLADSTISQGMHWSVFFVRAATASPTIFYDAAPDSGWSLDNLAPSAPNNLVLNAAQLDWTPAAESDFDYYRVYGSSTGALDGSEMLLGATSANSYSVSGSPQPYYLVTVVDFAGNEGEASAVQNTATGVENVPPRDLWVRVSPNPFNPATSIRFYLPEAAPVSLRVYDQRGRLVDTLLRSQPFPQGEHLVPYRSELPSGVYLLKLISANQSQTAKISLVR